MDWKVLTLEQLIDAVMRRSNVTMVDLRCNRDVVAKTMTQIADESHRAGFDHKKNLLVVLDRMLSG